MQFLVDALEPQNDDNEADIQSGVMFLFQIYDQNS